MSPNVLCLLNMTVYALQKICWGIAARVHIAVPDAMLNLIEPFQPVKLLAMRETVIAPNVTTTDGELQPQPGVNLPSPIKVKCFKSGSDIVHEALNYFLHPCNLISCPGRTP